MVARRVQVTRRMPVSTPAKRARRRRQRQRRAARLGVRPSRANNSLAREMANMRLGAPVASSLVGRRGPGNRVGALAPVNFFTSDLLETVQLGTLAKTVVYNNLLSPQDLPDGSRGKRMSRLFAKYRPLAVTIRIESAISTAAGGQYAAFFDPNPKNDWLSVDAVSALTSMPV